MMDRRVEDRPILLEVIAPILDRIGLCFNCQVVFEGTGMDTPARGQYDYPEDWRKGFQHTLSLVNQAADALGDRLLVRWSDPRSLRGLWLSLRYRVRQYPAFVLDNGDRIVGLRDASDGLLQALTKRSEMF